jgi:hypothetical protein
VKGTLENFQFYTKDCTNITTRQGASPYDFKDWSEPLDLVFLDGVHHNPVFWHDLNFWFWHLKPGGICCGDDFARTHPDVVWGVHDFAKTHGLTFFVQGRIWMMPRPPHKPLISALFSRGWNDSPNGEVEESASRPVGGPRKKRSRPDRKASVGRLAKLLGKHEKTS